MIHSTIDKIIRRHFKAIRDEKPMNSNSIIVGPTGCGKTYSIKDAIARYQDFYEMNVPFIEIDATTLTQEGYIGHRLSSIMYHAVLKEEGDGSIKLEDAVGLMEGAIVYVDEIDKLSAFRDRQGHAVSIQTNFLTWLMPDSKVIVSNMKNTHMLELKTSYITFIFSGAFQSMYDSSGRNPLGFKRQNNTKSDKMTHDKLIKCGLIKELVYRLPYLHEMKPYSKAQLRDIIRNSPEVKYYKENFNLKLNLNSMVNYVYKHPAGLRGLAIYLAQKDLDNEDDYDRTMKELK